MTFSKTAKALGIAALVFSVSGCETLNLTGSDNRFERVEVSPQECQDRGGVTVVSTTTGEQTCRIQANSYDDVAAAAPGAVTAASSSAGGAGTAAAIAGLSLVLILAVSDSSSGTN